MITKIWKGRGLDRMDSTRICLVNLGKSLVIVWRCPVIAGECAVAFGKCVVSRWIRSVIARIWKGGGVGHQILFAGS